MSLLVEQAKEPPQVNPSTLSAPIDSFSSIVAGGITFDIDSAQTLIEGQSGNTSTLQAGMWIDIEGTLNDDQVTATAANITFSSRIAGAIQTITSSNQIQVNGVSIILSDDIQYDDDLSETLSVGLNVKLSGSYDDNDFEASYIGPNTDNISITKSKDDLENSAFSQALNNDSSVSVLRIRARPTIFKRYLG